MPDNSWIWAGTTSREPELRPEGESGILSVIWSKAKDILGRLPDPLMPPTEILRGGIEPEKSQIAQTLGFLGQKDVRKHLDEKDKLFVDAVNMITGMEIPKALGPNKFLADVASIIYGVGTWLPTTVSGLAQEEKRMETLKGLYEFGEKPFKVMAAVAPEYKGIDYLEEIWGKGTREELKEEFALRPLGVSADVFFAVTAAFGGMAGLMKVKTKVGYWRAKQKFNQITEGKGISFEEALADFDTRFPGLKLKERLSKPPVAKAAMETVKKSAESLEKNRPPELMSPAEGQKVSEGYAFRDVDMTDWTVRGGQVIKNGVLKEAIYEQNVAPIEPPMIKGVKGGRVVRAEEKPTIPTKLAKYKKEGAVKAGEKPPPVKAKEALGKVEKPWLKDIPPEMELPIDRVTYEKGRFLEEAAMALSPKESQAVVQHLVRLKHPKTFEPTSTRQLIKDYAKEIVASRKPAPVEQRYAGFDPRIFWRMLDRSFKWKEMHRDYLDVIRLQADEIRKMHDKVDGWEKDYKESQLEDAGAMVEGIKNLRTGEEPVATGELNTLVRDYKTYIEQLRKNINEYLADFSEGEYIDFLQAYLPHFYTNKSIKRLLGSRWLKESPNARQRKIPTLDDPAIQKAGLVPLTQNIATLTKIWGEVNWKVAASKHVGRLFKNLVDGEGNPMVVAGNKPGVNWWSTDNPIVRKIYGRKLKDGRTVLFEGKVWFHPEIKSVAKLAFERPLANRTSIMKAYDFLGAVMKSAQLSLSLFHHIALTESAAATLGTWKLNRQFNPLRGVFIMGKEARAIRGKPFEFTFRAGKLLADQYKSEGIRAGLKFESARADVGYNQVLKALRNLEARTRTIPYLKRAPQFMRWFYEGWNKILWRQYHEGLKLYSFHRLKSETYKNLPVDMSPEMLKTVNDKIASFVNDAFGGQEWEAHIMVSPRGLLYLRRGFLAPDWTLSNLRIAGRLVSDIKDPLLRKMVIRYWRNMAANIFITHQAVNLATVGKFTWENEKGHKFDWDVTPFVKSTKTLWGQMPWTDTYNADEDKQRYYAKFAKQAREVFKWFDDPLKEVQAKMNPFARELVKQFTGYEPGSDFPADWKKYAWERGFWTKDAGKKRLLSVAETFVPFSWRGSNFAFSLPLSKGMTKYKAINAFQKALDSSGWILGGRNVIKRDALKAIADACRINGIDPKPLFSMAIGEVRSKYYRAFYDAFQDGNMGKINEIALILKDLQASDKGLGKSMEFRGLSEDEIGAIRKYYRDLKKGG